MNICFYFTFPASLTLTFRLILTLHYEDTNMASNLSNTCCCCCGCYCSLFIACRDHLTHRVLYNKGTWLLFLGDELLKGPKALLNLSWLCKLLVQMLPRSSLLSVLLRPGLKVPGQVVGKQNCQGIRCHPTWYSSRLLESFPLFNNTTWFSEYLY